MGGGRKPTLVEVGERHHLVVGWRRHVFLAGQQLLLGRGLCAEKTTMDKALHVLGGDVRMAPWIHWRWGWKYMGSTAMKMRRQKT